VYAALGEAGFKVEKGGLMSILRRSWGSFLVAGVALTLLVPVARAADQDLFAWLGGSHSYPSATGNAEYGRDATGRELEVTIRNIMPLAGRRIAVSASGRRVGTMLVSRAGRAHREWKSERGQYVPAALVRSLLSVRTATGVLIVSGRFHVDTD
jgi:hypothetical protein